MERKAASGIMLTLLVISMLPWAIDIQPIKTESTAILSVDPPTSTALVGETFTINVTITDVSNLFGWQVLMHFDPNVLQVDNVTEGPFLGSTGNETVFLTNINNDEGYLVVGGVFMAPFPEEGVTGNGILTTIVFNAASYGTTTLEFDKDEYFSYLREIRWFDYKANIGYKLSIPCTLVDGFFHGRAEHELQVSLTAPQLLPLGESTMLNTTVVNFGENNETDVKLSLLINSVVVGSVTIPKLVTGASHNLSYVWTPTIEGTYNVTAYALPVPGEDFTANNQETIFVTVASPLIQPVEGQWANYTITLTEKPTNTSMVTRWDFTYSKYVSPYQMNVTLRATSPWGGPITMWLTLNVMTRQVEAGIWAGIWYPLWIETNVTIGSTVRIFDLTGTVIGSRFVEVGELPIDSWELEVPYYYGQNYIYLFDKVTGVLTGAEGENPYFIEHWELTATNILRLLPVEANPETGTVGTQVTITGAEATPNGTVEIYWDNDFLGTTASDSFGNFSYTFTVPPTIRGPHHVFIIDVTTHTPGIAAFTVVPSISITPTTGSIGAMVQVTGFGFGASEHVALSFDDMRIAEILADEYGSFSATFNIPLSEAGLHSIKAWYDLDFVETSFTVVDVTPLEIQMDVGTIYFEGETAEFYVQTCSNGVPVDATFTNVTLHKPDGTVETLVARRIAKGLYKIECLIKGKGSELGTYALVIEASYSSDTVNAVGTCLKTFIVKSPWREWEREAPKVALSAAGIVALFALIIVWRRKDQKLDF